MGKRNKRVRKSRTVQENRAISSSVDALKGQGLPTDRATAAAFRMFRENELYIPKPPAKPVKPHTLNARQRQRQIKLARKGAALFRQYFKGLK